MQLAGLQLWYIRLIACIQQVIVIFEQYLLSG